MEFNTKQNWMSMEVDRMGRLDEGRWRGKERREERAQNSIVVDMIKFTMIHEIIGDLTQ